MDKEGIDNNNQFEQLTAFDIWKKQYRKEIDCKKNIIEYIEIVRMLIKNESLSQDQIKDTYKYIYDHIEKLKDTIKPNTMMFLKNNLKSQLGKHVKEKDPKLMNCFIEFFTKAYPENYRRTDFTWVLVDINNITEEQIWTTLVYINKECLNNNLILNPNQKKDIVGIIEMGVSKKNIKFVNKIRSLEKLTDVLKISIVSVDGVLRVISK